MKYNEADEIEAYCYNLQASVKRATRTCNLFSTLLQNELNSNVARFTTLVQTC